MMSVSINTIINDGVTISTLISVLRRNNFDELKSMQICKANVINFGIRINFMKPPLATARAA